MLKAPCTVHSRNNSLFFTHLHHCFFLLSRCRYAKNGTAIPYIFFITRNFPGLSTQPAYGTDYTLAQTADKSALKLIYKSSFLKKHEWSTDNIGAEITLISTDGRKFNKKFNLNVKVDTPPKLSYVTIGKTARYNTGQNGEDSR